MTIALDRGLPGETPAEACCPDGGVGASVLEHERRPSVLRRLQRGMEALYRLPRQPDVEAFVVDAAVRDLALTGGGEQRRPREQLLVLGRDDEVALALFVDPEVLANLERHDPVQRLDAHNVGDFCLAVEGVSHFLYVTRCAKSDRPVSALELELQGEVDKFVTCLLLHERPARSSGWVRALLFEMMRLAPDLSREEHERYVLASQAGERYARSLDVRFVQRDRTEDMLCELRRFYRMGLSDKLSFIRQAA